MGTSVIVKGTSFLKSAIEFDAVVSSGLVGLFFPVGDLADIGRNFAAGGADAQVVGTPVMSPDGGARFTGQSAYLQTDLPETDDFTAIIIGKSPDDGSSASTRAHYLGNYGSANEAGISGTLGSLLGIGGATSLIGNAAHFNDAGSTTATSGNRSVTMGAGVLNQWRYMSFSGDDTTSVLSVPADGLASNGITYPYVRTKSTGKLRIGSSFSAIGAGRADIACAAIYNRVLTDDERALARTQFAAAVASYIGASV